MDNLILRFSCTVFFSKPGYFIFQDSRTAKVFFSYFVFLIRIIHSESIKDYTYKYLNICLQYQISNARGN